MTLNKTIPLKSFIGLSVCILFCVYWLHQSLFFAPHDFSNSYFGAYSQRQGNFNVGIFDPYTFNKLIANAGFNNIFASYNPNPPFTSLFFIPFTWLPVEFAKFLFNSISVGLFIVSLIRLFKFSKVPLLFTILVPLILFVPIRNQILFGQTYFLLFFLLSEGYLAHQKGQLISSSILWSLATLLKVFPAILFLFLLLKKDWKGTLYLGMACLLLFSISWMLQGTDVWKVYLTEILPENNMGKIGAAFSTNYQSALFLLKYLFVYDLVSNPTPWISNPIFFDYGLILFKSFIIAICCSSILKRNDLLSFGILLLGGMLLSPYSSTYGNIFLLILLLAMHDTLPSKWMVLLIILVFILSNFPTQLTSELPVLFRFHRFILLVVLFLVAFYLSRSNFSFPFFVGSIILFLSSHIFRTKEEIDPSIYLLTNNDHILIFDYQLKNDTLIYYYWDVPGECTATTSILGQTLSTAEVNLKNNQIFWGNRQLTFSSDLKKEVSLLDGQRIIYLSDKGKGRGFYTLRTIPVAK